MSLKSNIRRRLSHFGVTHAEDGKQVTEIEAYITERPTLPTYFAYSFRSIS